MPLSRLHDLYLRSLRVERNASQETLTAYRSDFALFLAFIKSRKRRRDDLRCFTPENFRDYLIWLREEGRAPATLQRRLNSLSAFATWLVRWDWLDRNPMDRLIRPKRVRKLREYLHPAEVRALLALTLSPSEAAMRALFMYAGLRRGELIALEIRYLDLERGLMIVNGKGDKQRGIWMTPALRDELTHYVLSLGPQESTQPLFTGQYGRRIDRHVVNAIVRRWGQQIGRPLHPHLLRHTLATYLAEQAPLRYVQEVLGHESIETTTIYAHVREPRLRETMAAFKYQADGTVNTGEEP